MLAAADQPMMETARTGVSAAAFPDILRAHQSMVFSIALHYLHDRAVAEEIAQDVFLQLYRQLPKLESETHAAHWLRRATSHRCIDQVRRKKFQPQVSLDAVAEPSASSDPSSALLSERLRKLIASLPEKPRMVMVLRYQEDVMPEEIARILDMPVRTVKSHLQRSITLLREKMNRR